MQIQARPRPDCAEHKHICIGPYKLDIEEGLEHAKTHNILESVGKMYVEFSCFLSEPGAAAGDSARSNSIDLTNVYKPGPEWSLR